MSRTKQRFTLTASLLIVLSAVLAACSGSSGGSKQPVTVNVTLSEFKVDSSLTTFSVGVPYHFVVVNQGGAPHELLIMAPTNDPATLDAARKAALVTLTTQDLPIGATKTVDYTFTQAAPAGTLELACHLPGHYEAGMHTAIVVK